MYTALGWLSCKNCNLSVSAGSDIKESRGKWKQRRGRGRGGEREQGSGKVETEEEEEEGSAKGNLACGFRNFITVYCDLLWFLPARYPIPTIIITTSPTGWVLLEGNKGEDQDISIICCWKYGREVPACELRPYWRYQKSIVHYTTNYPANCNVNSLEGRGSLKPPSCVLTDAKG